MIERYFSRISIRRITFFSLNASLIGLIHGLLINPIATYFSDTDSELYRKVMLVQRYKAMSAKAVTPSTFKNESNSDDSARREFLTGFNEGEGGAQLQTLLKTITQTNGTRLNSARSLPSRSGELSKFLGARFALSGPIQNMQATLYAIEANKPALFITSAVITGGATSMSQKSNVEPILDAQLDIYGVQREEIN